MKTRLYDDLDEFVALTRPLLEVDPVRHSIALLVLALLGRVPEASDVPPVLLTVSRGDALAGQWLCTPPREALVSGLPTDCAGVPCCPATMPSTGRPWPSNDVNTVPSGSSSRTSEPPASRIRRVPSPKDHVLAPSPS